jgi:DNA replication protein DnaC
MTTTTVNLSGVELGVNADPNNEPPSVRCTCGKEHRWVWYDGPARRRAENRWVPRHMADGWWARPKLSPCSMCTADTALERENHIRTLLADAKIPGPYHGFSLGNEGMIQQRPGEDLPLFQSRAKAVHKFGATAENLRSMKDVRAWLGSNQGRLPRKWLVVYGPPGTGKTSILAAIARTLLTVKADEWVELRDDQLTLPKHSMKQEQWDYAAAMRLTQALVRRTVPSVTYVNAADLLTQWANRHRDDGYNANPLGFYAKTQVLMVDELARVPPPDAKQTMRDSEVELMQKLLQPRYDRGRLTILATNRDIGELTKKGNNLFGDAVADRLSSALHVRLGGPSWR